jgi:hypothetical protein
MSVNITAGLSPAVATESYPDLFQLFAVFQMESA